MMKFKRMSIVLAAMAMMLVGSTQASAATTTVRPVSITKASTIPVSRMYLSKTSATMTAGTTLKLTCTFSPSNATNKTVTWYTSNSTVATVSNGVITAKKAGTVTIYAKPNGGGLISTCVVTVKPKTIAVQSISLNKTSATVTAGSKLTLTCSFTPSNATNKTVRWVTDNPNVATVSNGVVTARRAGKATIYAWPNGGGNVRTCIVTVKAKVDNGSYANVSSAYSIFNTWRTTYANQWYWNSSNTAKVRVSGLKSLTRDANLENVAKIRAKESWIQYYQNKNMTAVKNHTRTNGTPWYTAYPSGTRGENIAFGQTTATQVICTSWAETNCYYADQGHRRNMLSKAFTRIGIACYTKDGVTAWAMSLG